MRPGLLVDGVAPGPTGGPLGRAALERIAQAVAAGTPAADPVERDLGRALGAVLRSRMSVERSGRGPRPPQRLVDRAWLDLRLRHGASTIGSLADRAGQKGGRR